MRRRGFKLSHLGRLGLRSLRSFKLRRRRIVYLGQLNHCTGRPSPPIRKQRCIFPLVACCMGQRKCLLNVWPDGRSKGVSHRHGAYIRVAGSQGEAAVENGQPEEEPRGARVRRIAGNLSTQGAG